MSLRVKDDIKFTYEENEDGDRVKVYASVEDAVIARERERYVVLKEKKKKKLHKHMSILHQRSKNPIDTRNLFIYLFISQPKKVHVYACPGSHGCPRVDGP